MGIIYSGMIANAAGRTAEQITASVSVGLNRIDRMGMIGFSIRQAGRDLMIEVWGTARGQALIEAALPSYRVAGFPMPWLGEPEPVPVGKCAACGGWLGDYGCATVGCD